MKHERKIVSSLATVIILVWIIGSALFVNAASTSNIFVISTGAYPGSSSYTIFSDGLNYYAKNGYGAIDFTSTDASTVINQAIRALPVIDSNPYSNCNPFGKRTGEIVLTAGEYHISSSIVLASGQWLHGAGQEGTVLIGESGVTVIRFYGNNTAPTYYAKISDLTIYGGGIGINASFAMNSAFERLHVHHMENDGIVMVHALVNTFDHISIDSCGGFGLYADALSNGNVFTALTSNANTGDGARFRDIRGLELYGCDIEINGGYGLTLYGVEGCVISGGFFEDNNSGGDKLEIYVYRGTAYIGNSTGITISGAWINSIAGGYGIYLTYCENVKIDNTNNFYDSAIANADIQLLSTAKNIIIEDADYKIGLQAGATYDISGPKYIQEGTFTNVNDYHFITTNLAGAPTTVQVTVRGDGNYVGGYHNQNASGFYLSLKNGATGASLNGVSGSYVARYIPVP